MKTKATRSQNACSCFRVAGLKLHKFADKLLVMEDVRSKISLATTKISKGKKEKGVRTFEVSLSPLNLLFPQLK